VREPELKTALRAEFKDVGRVGILYLVVCWFILEPVHVIFHMLEVPAWANRLVIILMAAAKSQRGSAFQGVSAEDEFAGIRRWAREIMFRDSVNPSLEASGKTSCFARPVT
jgi:hypothetical protein